MVRTFLFSLPRVDAQLIHLRFFAGEFILQSAETACNVCIAGLLYSSLSFSLLLLLLRDVPFLVSLFVADTLSVRSFFARARAALRDHPKVRRFTFFFSFKRDGI